MSINQSGAPKAPRSDFAFPALCDIVNLLQKATFEGIIFT